MKRSKNAQSMTAIRNDSIRTLNTVSIRKEMYTALSYKADNLIGADEFEAMFTKVFDFEKLTTLDKSSANAKTVIDTAFIAVTAKEAALECAKILEEADDVGLAKYIDDLYRTSRYADALAWKMLNMGIHRWLTTVYGWDACGKDSRAKAQRDSYKKYVLSGKIELVFENGRIVGEKWHGKGKVWSVLKKVI